MKRTLLSIIIVLALMVTLASGQEKREEKPATDTADGPKVGQTAPDFDLPWADQNAIHTKRDEWIKLSSLRGSYVILAFYPADWSGG